MAEITIDRAALLRDVASAITTSGYAVHPRKARKHQIALIATDVRLHSRAMHTRAALIDDVMEACGVSRSNARKMISMARKLEAESCAVTS